VGVAEGSDDGLELWEKNGTIESNVKEDKRFGVRNIIGIKKQRPCNKLSKNNKGKNECKALCTKLTSVKY
jgi:hypothetical protein